jgi:putative hemolysin
MRIIMLREDYRLLAQRKTPLLSLSMAQNKAEVREAQRLRYQVFAEEMGARLPGAKRGLDPKIDPRLDQDQFDPYCEHLLVRDNASGAVVGTYRLLSPKMAQRIGGYYAETEFDLSRLGHLHDGLVEVGRACVHPRYRNGAAIGLLWSGVTQYMQQMDYSYLIGCASIGMQDGGHGAASIYRRLSQEHLSPREWRVFPRNRLPLESLNSTLNAALPPLIKGYMRLGCFICGEPAWDADFNSADLLLLLPLSLMNKRYARHYLDQT